ncbi:hypothetical protein BO94DRAFT_148256 [Aspergillus sclerotioniger CBS 115572]|uniref:DUF862-domain-containing protein n=1 Tax=Aspergillus sclerotioniger CBS 115572 TaxID=1450535 RepID=A0A317W8S6_9EURO|nr:hypothetical protein BO94DRAFT_148256 [Aspergillus sclerotioniger CBS 115572]PWY81707.1 hypothetical protein BO94DRAFT_148256 [Aspergillus sclerotioniger CBS 115572]
MWSKSISAKNGFALVSLLLTTRISAAAVPSGPVSVSVTPSYVADVAENTHISTIGADGETALVPVVGGPECYFCPQEEENNQTIGGWALLGISGAGTYLPSAVSEFTEPIPVITVSTNGDPTYVPSKTTRQPATEVKRAETPTVSDAKYRILEAALGKRPEVGKAYALKQKNVLTTVLGVDVPSHYLLVAGTVKQTYESLMGSYELTFDGYCYDIRRTGSKDQYITFNNRCGTAAATSWYQKEDEAKFELLGEIKASLTPTDINNIGKEVSKEMEKKNYGTFTNNCRHFVMKLYAKIKA